LAFLANVVANQPFNQNICIYTLLLPAIDQAALDVAQDLDPSTSNKQDSQDDSHSARKESQFASHLKKSEGVSHFAKSKSLKQQRQYLPAFACRERLLKQIRENQGEALYRSLTIRRVLTHECLVFFFPIRFCVPSHHCDRRDGVGQNYSTGTILARRRIYQLWNYWLHTAQASGRYECCKACQRGDGGE
jgi:hypothetical protein